ncbi:alpha/beta fold hydrolase [Sphingomonas aracearum]|uniref:Alpha/beta hydrolase n=1 Tax=Sphingomonas aracearum TaxID=2283317 RepID=A0A369VRC9_9SPHN|nr:alpha/beta hydrolase [Sphingomonas aracearum]RDE04934.1 alpha/beta hydrolase [Sphingomonas aracearum]
MTDAIFPGFEHRRLPGHGIAVDAAVGGSGPPLLLLHGWPQTRMCWAAVAPALAQDFTVVVPDLRGYGRSDKPDAGDDIALYAKRTMALDQVATMRALGFDRFAVAGHDRGGRVAYRLAFDHPDAVSRVAVLDIVPTADVWRDMDAEAAARMWHWPMQAQTGGLPERLIGADPAFFVRYILGQQGGEHARFPEDHVADYIACATPEAIHGWCQDYRAGWEVDRGIDEETRGQKIAAPLLVLWGEQGSLKGKDALAAWRGWAQDVEGTALPGGHFVPEEQPDAVIDQLRRFFAERNESAR